MEKTILVTGKDTYLGDETSRFFLDRGCCVSASVTARKEPFPAVDEDKNLLVFSWNKRSPIGAKNFVLETLARFESIDEAYLFFAPEKEALSLVDLSVTELEDRIDSQLKGLTFLTRELLALQARQPKLGLNFVLLDEEYEDQPPVAAALYHGFKGLATGVLNHARKRGLPAWGFECHQPAPAEFLKFVLAHPRTDAKLSQPGRWHSFGDKKNFLSAMFKTK